MKNKVEPRDRASVAEQADKLLLDEKFSEAEDMYRKLVTGLEELLGETHPEVAKALHKLAAAQAAQEKFNESLTNEEQSKMLKSVIVK